MVSALASGQLDSRLQDLAGGGSVVLKQTRLECKASERVNYWQIPDDDTSVFFLFSYTWEAVDTKSQTLYKISVCGNVAIAACGASSAVCLQDLKTGRYRSVGE